jgi:hypothetical protein
MMPLLGGVGALVVAAVLGASLLVGGHGTRGSQPLPARPAFSAGAVVPHLAGLGYRQAEGILSGLRLRVAMVVRLPSSRSSGIVLRTYPPAGTAVRHGGVVTLYVSY